MNDRRRIFLLGGTGFIGAELTRQLVAARREFELQMLLHRRAPLRDLEQTDTYMGSLGSFDLALLDRFQPDLVIHLARMNGRGRWGRRLAAWRGARANRRLRDHLGRMKRPPRVIYVSGTLVYGDGGGQPVDEDHPLSPIAFAREYIAAERPWMEAQETDLPPVTIMRPPWIIGRHSWFGQYYLRSIRQEKCVPLFGDGRNLMSLLDVEDCAGLIAHAAGNSRSGLAYNLFAPGACLSQLEFAEKLASLTDVPIRRYSLEVVRREFGQAAAEAFTFSNLSSTKHPGWLESYAFKYPTIDAMIRKNLEAEQPT